MELWQRRTLGILALGGGVAGLLKVINVLFSGSSVELWITAFVAVLLFGGGVWCGLRLLEGQPGAESPNMAFWCLQIPIINSPLVGYDFYTTLRGVLSIKFVADDLGEYHLKFGAFADLGGNFSWSVLRFDGEWKFAINLVAVVAVCLLARSLRRISIPKINA
jgi:hypothetical protein